LRAYESTSALLEDLGHEVVDVPTPFGSDAVEQFEVLWSVLSTLIPVDPALEDQLMPLTRWLRDRGRAFSGVQLATAVSMMRFMARGAMEATAAYDAVLTPTLAQLPALVGGIRDDADPASDFDEQKRFTPWTAAYNVTGQPAMSLPLYWTAAGLPVGVQLVGRPFGETGLISLGAQLEEARPWAHRRPASW